MSRVQIIPGDFTITNPDWPTVPLWRTGHVFTSDDFTGEGELVGRPTNTSLGGQPVLWEGASGAWLASGERLVQGTGTGALYVRVPQPDYEFSTVVGAIPTVGSQISLALRREGIAYFAAMQSMTLQFYSDGTGRIDQRYGGETTSLGTFTGAIRVGETLRVRLQGPQVTVISGSRTLLETTTSVLGTGYAGYASTTAGVGVVFDDMTVTAL